MSAQDPIPPDPEKLSEEPEHPERMDPPKLSASLPKREETGFGCLVALGFVGGPFLAFGALATGASAGVPAMFFLVLGAMVVGLFFRATRGLALGSLLALGTLALLITAICGRSGRGSF